jgi:hypothetical protein
MIRTLPIFALLALAACDAPAPRVDSAGEAARAAMEAATAAYAGCIETGAETIPVDDDAAGALAIRTTAACKPQRAALAQTVVAFNKLGYPNRTPNQLDAVAEASVNVLEKEARNAAVVTIVKRQTATAPAKTPAEGK